MVDEIFFLWILAGSTIFRPKYEKLIVKILGGEFFKSPILIAIKFPILHDLVQFCG